MSTWGQLHALPRRSISVCFTSHSGCKHQPNGPLVSATGLMQCGKNCAWFSPSTEGRKHDAYARPDPGHDEGFLARLADRLDEEVVVPRIHFALARHIDGMRRELGGFGHERTVGTIRNRCRRYDRQLEQSCNSGECLRLLWQPIFTSSPKANIAGRDRDVRWQRRTSQTARPAQL